jgi:hypothetical protein
MCVWEGGFWKCGKGAYTPTPLPLRASPNRLTGHSRFNSRSIKSRSACAGALDSNSVR